MKHPLTALLLLSLSPCISQAAEQPAPAQPPTQQSPAAEEPAGEQMRAYVDPETGALTSQPPAGSRALEIERQMDLIREIRHPNGMTEWVFNGQADEAIVATAHADGIATHCETHGVVHAHAPSMENNDE